MRERFNRPRLLSRPRRKSRTSDGLLAGVLRNKGRHRPLFTLSDFELSGLSRTYSRPLIFTTCAPGCRPALDLVYNDAPRHVFPTADIVVLIAATRAVVTSFDACHFCSPLESSSCRPRVRWASRDKSSFKNKGWDDPKLRAGFSEENRPEDTLP